MRADVTQRLGLGALNEIRQNPTFPYKTGNLKWNATSVKFVPDGFSIVFDGTIAPYIPFLENGVEPQFYMRQGKTVFTRGSTRHRGFISERATSDIISYLARSFGKPIGYMVINNQGKQYGNLDEALKKRGS